MDLQKTIEKAKAHFTDKNLIIDDIALKELVIYLRKEWLYEQDLVKNNSVLDDVIKCGCKFERIHPRAKFVMCIYCGNTVMD